MRTDMPRALDDDPTALELRRSERDFTCGAHPVQHTERGDGRWIAGATARGIDARDPRRLAGNAVHVGLTCAHVLGGEIPPAEYVDPPAQGTQELRRTRAVRIVPEHNRLAAALLQSGDGSLHRHRLRQAQHIGERVPLVRIVPKANAAEGGAERGRMDRDDRTQPDFGIGERRHLLVRGHAPIFPFVAAITLHAGAYQAAFRPDCAMLCTSLRHSDDEFVAWPRPLAEFRRGRATAIPLLHPWANRLGRSG